MPWQKVAMWGGGLILSLGAYIFNAHIEADAKDKTEIKTQIQQIVQIQLQNTKDIAALVERDKLVNTVELNADVKSLKGQVNRIELLLKTQ